MSVVQDARGSSMIFRLHMARVVDEFCWDWRYGSVVIEIELSLEQADQDRGKCSALESC